MQLQQNIDFIYLIVVLLLLLYILSYFKIFSALKYKVIFIFIIFPYFLVSAICPTLRKTNDKCLSDLKSSLKSAARRWNGKQSTPLSSLCFFSRRPAFLKATFRCQYGMMQLAWSTECKKTSKPQKQKTRGSGFTNFVDRKRALNVVVPRRQHTQTATGLWQAIIPKLCGESFVSVDRLQRNMQCYRILISLILFLYIFISMHMCSLFLSIRVLK